MPPFDPALLNDALELALAWGPDSLRSVAERLREKHPALPIDDCEALERVVERVRHELFEWIGSVVTSDDVDDEALRAETRTRVPWASEKIVLRLVGQGIYVARK